jgi:amino acid adenylation domain-containing protein
VTGVSYQRSLEPAAASPELPPAEHAAVAALAAIETSARLGRRPAIQIRAGGTTASLAEWPGSVRRQTGPRARQAISGLLSRRPRASEHRGAEWLTVSLEISPTAGPAPAAGSPTAGPAPATRPAAATRPGPDPRGPHLRAQIRDGILAVTVTCPPGDSWWRARAAVAETFAEILACALEQPAAPIAQARGISPASEQRVLRQAGHAVSYGPFVPVPALIEWQADRHPNRAAIVFRDTTVSYARLDQLANGLARTLAARGVRHGQLVPVLIGNSLELPIAWLALMKLGAPFVPLDPAWPADRIAKALDLLAPQLVLHRAATPPATATPQALPVDATRIKPSIGRPGTPLSDTDLIYGILTSGRSDHSGHSGRASTPKCALNTHAGLANRLAFMTRYFAATGDEVVLQNSRHTFDSAFWQMFWPLTTGARCVIPVQGDFLNTERTIGTVGAYAITVTDFVPSAFNVMVALADGDTQARARLSSLRHVIVGGEEINPQMAHRLMAMLPGVSVTNGYGPPETAIGVVFHRVTAGDGDTIPVGRPISNCYALVVDSSLNLLPPGATGEIAIGGVCVGAGYHRDPDRTARAFPANPVPAIPGDRLYLTGDLGYFDERGQLCLTGRKDSQVRIGGVRIELGEIEVAAENCPGVRHATVLSGRLASRKALALFVAGEDGLTEAVLRRRLVRALPRGSVPRYILVLREMPLTDHGKVDRRALRGLLDRRLGGGHDREKPPAGTGTATGTTGSGCHDEDMTDAPAVTDNQDASRFEHVQDGLQAVLTYRTRPGKLVLLHTETPPQLEGRGIGSALVRAALERAEREHLTLVVYCPFARAWLERHPDAASRVTVELPRAS